MMTAVFILLGCSEGSLSASDIEFENAAAQPGVSNVQASIDAEMTRMKTVESASGTTLARRPYPQSLGALCSQRAADGQSPRRLGPTTDVPAPPVNLHPTTGQREHQPWFAYRVGA